MQNLHGFFGNIQILIHNLLENKLSNSPYKKMITVEQVAALHYLIIWFPFIPAFQTHKHTIYLMLQSLLQVVLDWVKRVPEHLLRGYFEH